MLALLFAFARLSSSAQPILALGRWAGGEVAELRTDHTAPGRRHTGILLRKQGSVALRLSLVRALSVGFAFPALLDAVPAPALLPRIAVLPLFGVAGPFVIAAPLYELGWPQAVGGSATGTAGIRRTCLG